MSYTIKFSKSCPDALKAQTIRDALGIHEELVHITVETNTPSAVTSSGSNYM
ncbi:MAG: hypothetical protein JXK05_10010 [Campylobacterales bacterium]|nr:hypothetical protein [Campylobacterales bacterium]